MLSLNRLNDPPVAGPDVWVRRLGAREKLHATILSPHFWGFMVHWAGNHSEPCYREIRTCPGHRRGLPLKWKGYLYVIDHVSKEFQFLELPPGAAKELVNWYHPLKDLRGQRCIITRGEGSKARLKVEIQLPWEKVSSDPLPKDKDPIITLCRLWGVDPTQVNLSGDTEVPNTSVA